MGGLRRKPLLRLDLPDPLGNRETAFATDADEEHIGSFLTAVERTQARSSTLRATTIAKAGAKALQQAGHPAIASHLTAQLSSSTATSESCRRSSWRLAQ